MKNKINNAGIPNLNPNKLEILINEIIRHKRLYYQGKAEISDEEYDCLEEDLKKIDPQHWVLNHVGFNLNNVEKKFNTIRKC